MGRSVTLEGAALPRRPARSVRIGSLAIGSEHPILIQSMTTADTLDTGAVVGEIARLAAAGCPLVRLTVSHMKAAENLPLIREELSLRGLDTPLVADIHFTPHVAIAAADFVDKVRINPGNYADRKRFELKEYSNAQYAEELARIRLALEPLALKLRERRVALRIGTNHGSLSDRIMSRYGDSPEGMVESALEFARICEAAGFGEVVLSMKSSIPSVMIAANRLLVRRMADEGMDYPIHLGVTEAGGGIEGRVKSAIGIGALLLDGIGDTIRVSLTEDSEFEIDACSRILEAAGRPAAPAEGDWRPPPDPPLARRATRPFPLDLLACGSGAPPRVEARIATPPWGPDGARPAVEEALGVIRSSDPAAPRAVAEILSLALPPCDLPSARIEPFAAFADAIRSSAPGIPIVMEWDLRAPREIHAIEPFLPWIAAVGARPRSSDRGGDGKLAILARLCARRRKPLRLRIEPEDSDGVEPAWPARVASECLAHARVCLAEGCDSVAILLAGRGIVRAARAVAAAIDQDESTRGIPIFIELPLDPYGAAMAGGSILLDGIGDGLCIPGMPSPPMTGPGGDLPIDPVRLAYTILQGCRLRLTRAEFIACPSCGRTQFDLLETTRRIREKTAHLSGTRIAIMGCVVNGPGEMADADFGYVGSAPGRVDLYVGRERVRQAIREEEAVDRLIDLIRERGIWIDPPSEAV